MFPRLLRRPTKSFFLLGPRGTGKTTWLKTLEFTYKIDLLYSRDRLKFQRDPGILKSMLVNCGPKDWVLIDEIQKVPELLEEVHAIYEERKINFALSGSSARKLKRSHANLLAGRAINYQIFPLCFAEYGDNISLDDCVNWGTLPLAILEKENKEDTLDTYIQNYLQQELMEEGVLRKLDPFVRFIQVAGIMNGQILNVENISREAKVGRSSIEKYFNVLYETLVAYTLPAYQPGLRVKETGSPKFYFFDGGVARAAAGLTRDILDNSYRGFLFENYLLNEVRAYNSYFKKDRLLFYYNVANSFEIDLVIQLKKKTLTEKEQVILIEMKFSKEWKREWSKSLLSFGHDKKKVIVKRMIGIYAGNRRYNFDGVEVYPVRDFLQELFDQKIF